MGGHPGQLREGSEMQASNAGEGAPGKSKRVLNRVVNRAVRENLVNAEAYESS
jgi:hypothetical protein